jgi:hypothetical protein
MDNSPSALAAADEQDRLAALAGTDDGIRI